MRDRGKTENQIYKIVTVPSSWTTPLLFRKGNFACDLVSKQVKAFINRQAVHFRQRIIRFTSIRNPLGITYGRVSIASNR